MKKTHSNMTSSSKITFLDFLKKYWKDEKNILTFSFAALLTIFTAISLNSSPTLKTAETFVQEPAIQQEAEVGKLSGGMLIRTDKSGRKFIVATKIDNNNIYNGSMASYQFTVPKDATYQFFATVNSPYASTDKKVGYQAEILEELSDGKTKKLAMAYWGLNTRITDFKPNTWQRMYYKNLNNLFKNLKADKKYIFRFYAPDNSVFNSKIDNWFLMEKVPIINPTPTPTPAADCPTENTSYSYKEYYGNIFTTPGVKASIDGKTIQVLSSNGKLIGCGKAMNNGVYDYTSLKVYGTNKFSNYIGANPGEAISFMIDGKEVATSPWKVSWYPEYGESKIDLYINSGPGILTPIGNCPIKAKVYKAGADDSAINTNPLPGIKVTISSDYNDNDNANGITDENGEFLALQPMYNTPVSQYLNIEVPAQYENPGRRKIFLPDCPSGGKTVYFGLVNKTENVPQCFPFQIYDHWIAGYINNTNNLDLIPGMLLRIYNSRNELIGCQNVEKSNDKYLYKLTNINTTLSDIGPGLWEGEELIFKINGINAISSPYPALWSSTKPPLQINLDY